MRLSDIFTAQRIKLGIDATDKDKALEELVDFLFTAYGAGNRDEILIAIREREEKMTTGIKKGIAIPHAKISSVSSLNAIVGISGPGIDYNSLDNNPVHLVFLFVSNADRHREHLEFLEKLARLIETEGFYDDMMLASDEPSISGIIRKYESRIENESSTDD
jgi:PTS system nitrogen regulatory IIA component